MYMEFKELIKERYSCRKFKDTPLEQETIDAILRASNHAPTGKNNQSQRILVVRSEEARSLMKECTPCSFDAPVILLMCYDTDAQAHNDWEEGNGKGCGHDDAAIVMTHLMLACYDEGLGCTWVAYRNEERLREVYNIPDTYQILGLLPLGYPADDAKKSDRHFVRKELSETVCYDSF